MLRRAVDWILLTKRLDEARVHLAAEEQRVGAHLQQARLVAEVMRRVAEPAETLPPGNPAAVIVALGREAVASILPALPPQATVASDAPPSSISPDPLAQALDQAPQDRLLAAVPDAAALGAVKEALLARRPTVSAPVAGEDDKIATRVRSFVEALLWNADAPRRQVDKLLVFRFGRLAAIGVVLGLVAVGVFAGTRGGNLVAGKPFKTSSTWTGCATDPTCDGQLLFHTIDENQPWAQFDMLKPQTIHRIEVKNRPDCCGDRIVPLVVEASVDGRQWTEVGRKNEEFATWVLTFPKREARYIKLHIARVSTFHIKDLIVQ